MKISDRRLQETDKWETSQGAFAFNYSANPSPEESRWLRRFRVIVTGGVLTPRATTTLSGEDRELCFYHWGTGIYKGDSDGGKLGESWRSQLRRHGSDWLLNANQPLLGPDGVTPAYYFDPCSTKGNDAWANYLTNVRRHCGYQGIFLDLLGTEHLHPDALMQYQLRHPETPFADALRKRLICLRRCNRHAILFSNQAYRHPEQLLPLIDWDLTESLMTSYAWGTPVEVQLRPKVIEQRTETYYRPWAELEGVLDSIDQLAGRLNPRLRILHLNYLNPSFKPVGKGTKKHGRSLTLYEEIPDREAIYYGHAAAKLWGHENYTLCPQGQRFATDRVFFVDLGRPLGSREETGGLIRRHFLRGLAVINSSGCPQELSVNKAQLPPGIRGLWDCFAQRATGLTPVVKPSVAPVSGQIHPSGRIYLYLT